MNQMSVCCPKWNLLMNLIIFSWVIPSMSDILEKSKETSTHTHTNVDVVTRPQTQSPSQNGTIHLNLKNYPMPFLSACCVCVSVAMKLICVNRNVPVWWIQAKFTAFINIRYILIDGINGFQYSAGQTFEFAQFVWLFSAIVLQIIRSFYSCVPGICEFMCKEKE